MNNFIKANNLVNENSLIKKFNISVSSTEIISKKDLSLDFFEKSLIIEKLLEAHQLAEINFQSGNITKRGFASNVCTMDNLWALGTNFNNTRNEISSVCGERSAILAAYNSSLINYMQTKSRSKFNFKIKYICMAQATDIDKIEKAIVPCEDCLAWFNTSRYFDDNTIIFSFERNDCKLCLKALFLDELLPFRGKLTSNKFCEDKKIVYSALAKKIADEKNINNSIILKLVKSTYESYLKNNMSIFSNQNISCSILANGKTYISNKIDWTKRWFCEPLLNCLECALKENSLSTDIIAVCYFGDEYSGDDFNDGVVSIKSLGRIRQKYATNNTLLILNFDNFIQVITIGEYLPFKFIQGYKI